MKVKIISDGTRAGTKIVNAETGESIEGIVSAQFTITVDREFADLIIWLKKIPAELQGDAKFRGSA